MAVNLNKQNRNKVNLSKERSFGNGKVKLTKTPAPGQEDSSIITSSLDGGRETFDDNRGTQTEKSKHKFLPWLLIPIAAIFFLILFVSFLHKKSDTDINNVEDVAEEYNDSSAQYGEISNISSDENESTDVEASQLGNESAKADEASNSDVYDEMDESIGGDFSAPESVYIDDDTLHDYEIITADVTWEEAFEDCIRRGGYLCRINSEEENEKIKELLNEKNVRGVVYLGGLREEESDEYHWIDSDKNPFDEILNSEKNMRYWFGGEPSFSDTVDDREIPECYMAIIYPGAVDNWVWNDVSNDVLSLAPNYYTGRLSYICEYE